VSALVNETAVDELVATAGTRDMDSGNDELQDAVDSHGAGPSRGFPVTAAASPSRAKRLGKSKLS